VLGSVILISILRHRGKVSFRKMQMEVDQLKRERKELLRQKEESVYKALVSLLGSIEYAGRLCSPKTRRT
jgi:hypothetical protein